MSVNQAKYREILSELGKTVSLVAVSKKKSAEEIRELYELGQRDFGENYVQELTEKQAILPKDIRWHFIGHLQSNKAKYLVPFIHLVQGIDSFKLLKEINKQAAKQQRVIDCLLQVHIAREETKFGFDEAELEQTRAECLHSPLSFVRIRGLMGMASFSNDPALVRNEFRALSSLYEKMSKEPLPYWEFSILSMGMSGDYRIAIQEGSNMVRIGSLIFGEREVSA